MSKLLFRYHWLLLFTVAFAVAILHSCIHWLTPRSLRPHLAHPESKRQSMLDGLYGYESIEQLNGRSRRFPSVDERVQVYMSNWYIPDNCTVDANSIVTFRKMKPQTPQSFQELILEELQINGTAVSPRRFLVDSQNTLGKMHFLEKRNMLPESCDSEYCIDMIRYFLPSLRRLEVPEDAVPMLFQFSDEETSRAFSPASQSNELYPNVPHFKKSRFSVSQVNQNLGADSCSRPLPFPSSLNDSSIPMHNHPIIYKLKTNRHYGMLERIPPQDLPWHEKEDKVVFRGTLTGMLAADSEFSMAYRSSDSPMLTDAEAWAKCQELDRCRLVYEANAGNRSNLVDVKLVTPRLQHIDIPESIYDVSMFGNRMTKQGLMKNKAIVMLEGNDAGTGLKWALFSNSVVFAPATVQFTSWAMEELLRPWYHFIPLDTNNFGNDLHDKMQWIIDHDKEARQIAVQGSLWIRDLWMHPDADRDDEKISDEIIKRYMRLFRPDPKLEL